MWFRDKMERMEETIQWQLDLLDQREERAAVADVSVGDTLSTSAPEVCFVLPRRVPQHQFINPPVLTRGLWTCGNCGGPQSRADTRKTQLNLESNL